MRLYDMTLSGNCYKVRLLLSMFGLEYESVPINTLKGEQRADWYRRLSPRGQIPALEDGETTVWDSSAILAYLARRYGGDDWFPGDPVEAAHVLQWVALAGNEIQYGLAKARAMVLFKREGDLAGSQSLGRVALDVVEDRTRTHRWLAGDRPTIGDIACYPYIKHAPDGGISLEPYPAVRRWLGEVESLPGYAAMDGGKA
jgi:glutathione S-transferase